MYHKRKDNGCESRILAANDETVLIEAHWGKNSRNIVNLTLEYFEDKYGFDPRQAT